MSTGYCASPLYTRSRNLRLKALSTLATIVAASQQINLLLLLMMMMMMMMMTTTMMTLCN